MREEEEAERVWEEEERFGVELEERGAATSAAWPQKTEFEGKREKVR